jgi:hypothetical protein
MENLHEAAEAIAQQMIENLRISGVQREAKALISQYVSGKLTAAEFANQFTPLEIMDFRQRWRDQLVLAVHAQISQYFHGLILEEEFRSNLSSLLL